MHTNIDKYEKENASLSSKGTQSYTYIYIYTYIDGNSSFVASCRPLKLLVEVTRDIPKIYPNISKINPRYPR